MIVLRNTAVVSAYVLVICASNTIRPSAGTLYRKIRPYQSITIFRIRCFQIVSTPAGQIVSIVGSRKPYE